MKYIGLDLSQSCKVFSGNLVGKWLCNPAAALTMRNGERGLEVVVAAAAAVAAAIEGRPREGRDDAKTPDGRTGGRTRTDE